MISELLDRGYGGSAAVIVPGSKGLYNQLPESLPPAGVIEACTALVNAIRSGSNGGKSHWVFLLGGAGNGKSHQMSAVLGELGLNIPVSSIDAPAIRSHWFLENKYSFCVVNDASIRRERASNESLLLARDIDDLFARSLVGFAHGLINVNRGILIEELQELGEQGEGTFAHGLLNWLSTEDVSGISCPLVTTLDKGYYRQGRLDNDGRTTVVHAVYLDQLSLLELQPDGVASSIRTIDCERHSAADYSIMNLNDTKRLKSPAGILLKKVALETGFEEQECKSCTAANLCPYLSNFRDMAHDHVRLGVLTMFRSAEIISGRLVTYRELWSCLATALIGPRRPEFNRMHPCDWVQQNVRFLDQDSDEADGAARQLLGQRFYLSLFDQKMGSDNSVKEGSVTRHISPVGEALILADPVKDITSSQFELVNDALKSASYAESPLNYLINNDAGISRVVHEIDRRALTIPVESFADGKIGELDRKRLLFECGQALYRLYALVNAIPAKQEVIKQWITLRQAIGEQECSFPLQAKDLEIAFNSLLFPGSNLPNYQNHCLLPLFTPRVEPVVSSMEKPTWCYALHLSKQDSIDWRLLATGDAIWAKLYKNEEVIAEFHLDYALCREALTHVFYSDTGCESSPGFSELGMNVSPRLERIRASVLGYGATVAISSAPVVVQAGVRVLSLN